jgi:hypothetical protein
MHSESPFTSYSAHSSRQNRQRHRGAPVQTTKTTQNYMKIRNIAVAALILGSVFLAQEAKAQFIKIDDFTNSAPGQLSGQTSDGPNANVWGHSTVSGAAGAVIITSSPTPGAGQPGSGTPLSPNAYAATTTSTDGAAVIALPVTIPTTSTAATVFMQFDMGASQTANNVNWDVANTPGSDAGGGGNAIELNANVPGRAGVTLRDNGSFVWLSADGINIFNPANSTIYNIWFVMDNAALTYVVYMQDANPGNTDLPNLTRMYKATSGAGGTEGTVSFSTNAIAFRDRTLLPLEVFIFGLGGGGDVAQYTYDIYEDPNGLDLTNPVTGLAPSLLSSPVITSEPQPEELYAGATAVFTVTAKGGGLHYLWYTNSGAPGTTNGGVAMADGGEISGSATANLTISNVSAANALNYFCLVTNANNTGYKATNTTAASLTIVSPNGAYDTALAASSPLHFYAFDDTGNPATGTEVAFDYTGGDNGIHGANCENGADGIFGPLPSGGFPGFSANNYAVQFAGEDEPNNVTIQSPWNLNTNSVTITAWINPATSYEASSSPIVLNRGAGTDVEGLIYNTSANLAPVYDLGYIWNDDANTTSWDSGLLPPPGQWSFVALTVTTTNATISVMNVNGVYSSTHVYPHPVAPFAGTTMIGDDPASAIGALTFNGIIDEVGILNQALSQSQLQTMFADASGLSDFPPTNSVAPAAQTLYPSQTALFSSVDEGSVPMTFTWQLNNANLVDGANSVGIISGSATPSLTISNLAAGDAGQSYYLTLVTSNSAGSFTSSAPAILTVSQPNPNQIITTTGFEASGNDWNTGSSWSDGNPASVSVYTEPGSTYEVVAGTLERTPVSSAAVFPGSKIVVEGNGVLVDGGGAAFSSETTTGEIRLKQSGATTLTNVGGTVFTDGGTVSFPDLQLNGGQIDNGTSSRVTLEGQMDILANSTIYVDSAADASIRTIQINSLLTGSGAVTLAYDCLGTDLANNDLVISNSGNTYSGQWNVVAGTLLGNAANSLGTNTITVGTNGSLETTYNINDPNGILNLGGQMFLYTTDTFNGMTVNGASVPAGTYTFAQLHSAYPSNFPANWTVQIGSTTGTNTGVGSITVLTTLAPVFTQQPTPAANSLYPGQTLQIAAAASGSPSYQWWFTNLSNVGVKLADGGDVSGSKSGVLTISSVVASNVGTYIVVAANASGSTTSSNAVLNPLLTPGSATLITMSVVESAGQDWNTGANWSDGNPASLSAYSEPGSTYEVLPGALLRTPALATNTAFPGSPLIITNGAELVLAHLGAGGIAFPDLQLIGGSMDNGADGLATLSGEIDILGSTNNVTIYTDAKTAQGLVVNFDVPGGVGGTNYAGYGACPDETGHTNWNPIVQTGGTGTTAAPSTESDGVTACPVTLTIDSGGFGEGNQYSPYGTYDNSAGAPANTPEALEANYLYVQNTFTPNFVVNTITNTLNNVPAGTYNLYLYGNDGGGAGGLSGYQNDWGITFTVSSDVAAATNLSTINEKASLTSNQFILGADYVVFSNVVVGAGGTITIAWTPNPSATSPDYFGANSSAAFNGLQLAAVVPPSPGARPFEISSLLTGAGTITYDSGAVNLTDDLRIAGAANTFSGQWIVEQGTLLGSGANSLGTNSITVGANGALETAYNVNDTGAGLILNGQMFLHQNDTFKTVSVNGAQLSPGTNTFAQLHGAFPANFPVAWPLQTGSSVSNGSGSLIVLVGPSSPKPVTIVSATLVGSTLTLSGTNGLPSGTYHVLTATNLTLSVTNWTVLTNGSFNGGGDFNVALPVSSSDRQRFYTIKSP